VQTFLPFASFEESAKVLDKKRLFKQVVEARQIISCLEGEGSLRWANHPAVRMWRGYEEALKQYFNAMLYEWLLRGGRSSYTFYAVDTSYELPWWLGWDVIHSAYRSNLLRKDPIWYGKFGWTEKDDLPYVWPV